MEVHRHRQVLLEQFYQFVSPVRRDQAAHVLDGDHVGTQSFHLLGLAQEIFVGEDLFRRFRSSEERFDLLAEGLRGILRVDGGANGAIGDTAVLADVFHRRFYVVHVIERVEDTHDAQTGFDGIAAETFDDLVGVRSITEQVASTRKSGEFGHIADFFLDGFQTGPGVFAQITHHRVGNGTAPNLHGVKFGVFVVADDPIDLLLAHSRSESRLLAVAQRQIADKEFSCHNSFILSVLRFSFSGNGHKNNPPPCKYINKPG